jgi:glycosyltransferase involved in cell wall biosynthesis
VTGSPVAGPYKTKPFLVQIAHILETLEVGGAEVLVVNMCRWQKSRGLQPAVHALYRSGPLEAVLQNEAIPVHHHHCQSRLDINGKLRSAFAAPNRPDAVHCHNAMATIITAPVARLAGVPRIVSTRHGLVPPPYDWKLEVQFSLAARFCDAVIGVSEATSRNLRNAPLAAVSRISTIYNGSTLPASNGDIARPENGGFTLVHIARLNPAKDQQTLLRAFALALKQAPDIRLWIVGGGALEQSLHALAQELKLGTDKVKFWGEQKQIGGYLAAADAFVLSSKSEGLPMSLLEAMGTGLPVIVTDIGGMPEAVNLHGSGLVVPAGNPEALGAAMVQLANAPEAKRQQYSEAARRSFEEKFSSDRMNEAYLRLLSPAASR